MRETPLLGLRLVDKSLPDPASLVDERRDVGHGPIVYRLRRH